MCFKYLAVLIFFGTYFNNINIVCAKWIKPMLEEQLALCVANISNKYFPSNYPVIIQTPSTWKSSPSEVFKTTEHESDIFLKALYNALSNSFLIYGYTNDNTTKESTLQDPVSIVILVTENSLTNQIPMISEFLHRIAPTTNPIPGKIIIITTSILGEDRLEFDIAFLLLDLLWQELHASDTIILIPDPQWSEGSDKEVPAIDVFGWVPQQQDDPCLKVLSTISYLDCWWSRDVGFLVNAELFPSKDITDMNGCTYVVQTFGYIPFMIEDPMRRSVRGGLYAKMIQALADASNFEIAYKPFDYNRKPDFSGPHIMNHTKSPNHCSIAYPHFKDDLLWFVPAGAPIPTWYSLLKIFYPTMWLSVIATYILGCIMYWSISKCDQIIDNCNREFGVSLVLLNILSTYLAAGITYKFRHMSSIIFFPLWLIYCLQIYTAYQSSLIGFLANPGEFPPIRDVPELLKSNLDLKTNIILGSDSINEGRWEGFDSYPNCLEAECYMRVAESRDLAMLSTRHFSELYIAANHTVNGRPKIIPLPEVRSSQYFTLQIHLGCYFQRRVDSVFHRLVSAGIVGKWFQEFKMSYVKEHGAKQEKADVFVLTLKHLNGVFLLLIIGNFLALVIFTLELLSKLFHKYGLR